MICLTTAVNVKLLNLTYLVVFVFILLSISSVSKAGVAINKHENINTLALSSGFSLEESMDFLSAASNIVSVNSSINDCSFIINRIQPYKPTDDFLLLPSFIWRENQKRTDQRFIPNLKN
jgi:hypothetical protein